MTSRVQKGGAVFRPSLKSRTRVEPKQTLGTGDAIGSDNRGLPTSVATEPASPSILPVQISQPADGIPQEVQVTTSNVEYSVLLPPPRRPPSLVPETPRPTNPLVLGSRLESTLSYPPNSTENLVPIPVNAGISASTISSSAEPVLPISSSTPEPSQPHVVSGSPFHISHTSGSENISISTNEVETLNLGILESTTNPKQLEANREAREPEVQAVAGTSAITGSDSSPLRPSKKRKSKEKVGNEHQDGCNAPSERRNNRSGSGTPRPRKTRGPSVPPFDPQAGPGEDLDPTVVTMASLCTDTGQGRISSKAAEILSNHAAWKAQNRAKRARMKTLMELKKYGREEDAEGTEGNQNAPAPANLEHPNPSGVVGAGGSADGEDAGSGFDYSQDLQTSRFNVQVRIGPNGEMVIDEESLVVDRTETEDTTNYTHVVESDQTKFVNSGTYAKRYRGSRWSAEETELFYDALSQFGENYELIAYVLPGRDRKSCKNKFKAEDKKNPARINYSLGHRTPVDIATLSRMTGKDFSGPVPEIRVPTPQPPLQDGTIESPDNPAPNPVAVSRKKKKTTTDDGVVIIGEADNFSSS